MRHLLLLMALLVPVQAGAEVEKTAATCESGVCFFWWPKLPNVKGWHQELSQSQHYGINALAPDGSTFKDAETVMYSKAPYKPRMPETKAVEDLIKQDKEIFARDLPGVVISDTKPLITGDGQKLRSVLFVPTSEGNWELTAYGEEDDYFLIFTLSSRTKSGYERALPAFENLIHRYKKKL